MKVRVTNVAGRVVALKSVNTRLTPLFDAQGNTLALCSNTGTLVDTYKYFPYGEIRISTGSHNNPFRYGGRWGYFYDSPARTYIRRRVLDPRTGSWMTVDPWWPKQLSYSYVGNNPTTVVDPTGMIIKAVSGTKCSDSDVKQFTRACESLRDCMRDAKCKTSLLDCVKKINNPPDWAEKFINAIVARCLGEGTKTPDANGNTVCISCNKESFPEDCKDICQQTPKTKTLGQTITFSEIPGLFDADFKKYLVNKPYDADNPQNTIGKCYRPASGPEHDCENFINRSNLYAGCTCAIFLCDKDSMKSSVLLHELGHCVGVGGSPTHDENRNDIIYRLEACAPAKIKGFK